MKHEINLEISIFNFFVLTYLENKMTYFNTIINRHLKTNILQNQRKHILRYVFQKYEKGISFQYIIELLQLDINTL
ncbi:hypothetical protein FOB69_02980 [Staphylococcus hominis]|uniref:Uncharacterized protein n=1 Tax=Staphylococcus hominis TaxID=1290 RepID=A0A6N0I226_STAHO|nr:hypothetical protein FOB69_02980 [Staphylococcus hominis]